VPPADIKGFEELYLVMPTMSFDLHQAIRMCDPMSKAQLQDMTSQLLHALAFMHQAGIVHRDLKPGNLMVNFDCDLMVADFGLAKLIDSSIGTEGDLTDYVVTRWFRPPELMLKYQAKDYDSKIDMWSVGCILAEMFLRKVLFQSKDATEQAKVFIKLLGMPPLTVVEKINDQSVLSFLKREAKKHAKS